VDFPGVVMMQPLVGDLSLPTLAEFLPEKTEFVSNAVADGRYFEGRQRIHEAGGQPPQAAVSQAGLGLFVQNVVQVETGLGHRRSTEFLAVGDASDVTERPHGITKSAHGDRHARAVKLVRKEFGSLEAYLWSFLPQGQPIMNRLESYRQAPSSTPLSVAMSRDLQKRGFRFVGPTICYAFMQAVGMVNDHEVACFRHARPARPPSKSPLSRKSSR